MNQYETVLLQGHPRYSFHGQAAEKMGIPLEQRLSMPTFPDLYSRLRQTNATALVAVVNSTIGRISESYDQLLVGDLTVCQRIDLPIVHPLYVPAGMEEADIQYVHTQSPAHHQCLSTLRRDFPAVEWIAEDDTALSAWAARDAGWGHAAITPHAAGRAAGLTCLRPEGVQDSQDNTTTFLLVTTSGNNLVPVDANITMVAVNGASTDTYSIISRLAREHYGCDATPLHASDPKQSSYIIELAGLRYHNDAGRIESILGKYASVKRIGGYVAAESRSLPAFNVQVQTNHP